MFQQNLIEAKYSPGVPNASAATVSHPSTNKSTQSPVVPVSSEVQGRRGLPTATLVQAVNDDMRLHQSVRECVKMSNLTFCGNYQARCRSCTTPLRANGA